MHTVVESKRHNSSLKTKEYIKCVKHIRLHLGADVEMMRL